MITCQHAKHLFDQYLDGELSPSLQAELHAHQLNCSDCQGELALLEACGDVIAHDRHEPVLSSSFTDRVLASHRSHAKPIHRRSWSRLVLTIGSPLAAAACIALAVLLTVPTGKQTDPTTVVGRVAGEKVRISDQQIKLLDPSGTHISISKDLASTPQMPAGFVDAIAGPIVEQTKNVFDNTKRSIDQLDSLIRLGFAGANSALVAGSRTVEADRKPVMAPLRSSINEPDMMDPFSPPSTSPPDPQNTFEVDDTIEAM